MTEIHGTIVESRGPYRVEAPPDPWKWATAACVFVLAAPLGLALAVLTVVSGIALAILGVRHRGHRVGIADHVWRSVIIRPFRAYPQPLHVYDHVVETDHGVYVSARQHGEFREGRLFPGHRVQLQGTRIGGALRIRSAVDETVGTHLTRRGSPWFVPFVVSASALLIGSLAALVAGVAMAAV